MKIGIIGLGLVGTAVRHGFTRIGHHVSAYDIKLPETSLQDVLPSEVIFISVPTPSTPDGSCDTSIVEDVVGKLAEAGYPGLVTIKSTIEPGTVDILAKRHPSLRLSFCPEFLRERAMYIDFIENHDVCIIGSYTKEDAELLREAHGALPKQFAFVTPLEAEFAKYFSNVFNSLRIVFANQFYDVCKAAGADYNAVKNAIVKHRNITNVYLDCNENYRGFGGHCLPKDTKAFARYMDKMLTSKKGPSLFDHILEINDRYKTTVL